MSNPNQSYPVSFPSFVVGGTTSSNLPSTVEAREHSEVSCPSLAQVQDQHNQRSRLPKPGSKEPYSRPYSQKDSPSPMRPNSQQRPINPSAPASALTYSPQQVHNPGGAGTSISSTQQHLHLKVEDALSYLDKVKVQFATQPHIYNRFLDVMKDFKAQAIDAPRVIQRVSELFKGFPSLILGFNPFLPQGYQIEISGDNSDRVSIRTPTGNSLYLDPSGEIVRVPPPIEPSGASSSSASGGSGAPATTAPLMAGRSGSFGVQSGVVRPQVQGHYGATTSVVGVRPPPRPAVIPGPVVGQPIPQAFPASSSAAFAMGSGHQPLEFTYAITYVNKIKERFQTQPEVYKKFLEILHTYQKQQKLLKEGQPLPSNQRILSENEVYQEVSRLFQGQDDLLKEFSLFLPEAVVPGKPFQTMIQQHPPILPPLIPVVKEEVLPPAPPSSAQMVVPLLPTKQPHPTQQPAVQVLPPVMPSTSAAPMPPTKLSPIIPKPMDAKKHTTVVSGSFTGTKDTGTSTQGTTMTLGINTHHRSSSGHGHLGGGSGVIHHSERVGKEEKGTETDKNPSAPSTQQGLPDPSPSFFTKKRAHSGPPLPSGSSSEEMSPVAAAKKKIKPEPISYEVSYEECAKYGELSDFQFFDKVKRALSSEELYDNFLRCLVLFNKELISKTELLDMLRPFIGSFPELMKWLRDFMGCSESFGFSDRTPAHAIAPQITSDLAMEIDFATCKQYGASYRALPKTYKHPKCSGRTELCHEVLNDTWVSFPSWSSEDTSVVSQKKTHFEECLYRTEEERFELDIVIEINRSTIQVLETANRKLQLMDPEDQVAFRLDDALGGRSAVVHQKAIRRIYGDKADDVIEGLKRNPLVALPVILRRLKAKDEEWREAQRDFNKVWREQLERYYLKSLDHQALSFKQTDLRQIRSKTLLNEIEILCDERRERIEEGVEDEFMGPHLMLQFPPDTEVFYDVIDLVIYLVRRQTGLTPEEKSSIKKLLKHALPDWFALQRCELSDDETESGDDASSVSSSDSSGFRVSKRIQRRKKRRTVSTTNGFKSGAVKQRCSKRITPRLEKLKKRAQDLEKEAQARKDELDSAAELLQLRPKKRFSPDIYYNTLLEQVKCLLDGQCDSSAFEDTVREMFTTEAYITFTMDKIIQNMVRQLQCCVSEETCEKSQKLYEEMLKKGGAGDPGPSTPVNESERVAWENEYQALAEELFTDQNCFKTYFFAFDHRVTFELLETEKEDLNSLDGGKHYLRRHQHEDGTSEDQSPKKGDGGNGAETPSVGWTPDYVAEFREYAPDPDEPALESTESAPDDGTDQGEMDSPRVPSLQEENAIPLHPSAVPDFFVSSVVSLQALWNHLELDELGSKPVLLRRNARRLLNSDRWADFWRGGPVSDLGPEEQMEQIQNSPFLRIVDRERDVVPTAFVLKPGYFLIHAACSILSGCDEQLAQEVNDKRSEKFQQFILRTVKAIEDQQETEKKPSRKDGSC